MEPKNARKIAAEIGDHRPTVTQIASLQDFI